MRNSEPRGGARTCARRSPQSLKSLIFPSERGRAIWWYNHVFMPLAVRFERKLALTPGLVDLQRADEILLVCRLAR